MITISMNISQFFYENYQYMHDNDLILKEEENKRE